MSSKEDSLSESIEALIDLGWSEYESKTYSALVSEGGTVTAYTIAKKSQVPQNRVYQILNKLKDKGHVNSISGEGGPTLYIAMRPQEVLEKSAKEYKLLVDNAIAELQKIQERSQDKEIPRTYTVIGKREVDVKVRNMIDTTEDILYFFVDTLFEIKDEKAIELLKSKAEEEKEIRLLTTERGVNDEYELEVVKKLENIDIRVCDESFTTFLVISDNKKVLFAIFSNPLTEHQSENKREERDYFGFTMEHESSLMMYKRLFEIAWDEAKPVDEFINNK